MPSLNETPFPSLIRSIPTLRHRITVSAEKWNDSFAAAEQAALFQTIFGGNPEISITRQQLLQPNHDNGERRIAEILLWGYPGNQRGIASNLLPHLPLLATLASNPTSWPQYFEAFSAIPANIGISTITKFAHFYGRHFEGLEALILDSRVIANTAQWEELRIPNLKYINAHRLYPEYLRNMNEAAQLIQATPSQLEFFIFSMGDEF